MCFGWFIFSNVSCNLFLTIMFLYVFFFNYLNIVLASCYTFDTFQTNNTINYDSDYDVPILRFLREVKEEPRPEVPVCTQMVQTSGHPFVVIFLHRAPGNFLGMGSIVGRSAILSAVCVVQNVMEKPEEVIILAGTRSTWWSKNAQVRYVKEIFVNSHNIAVATLTRGLVFTSNVRPIKISSTVIKDPKEFSKVFDKNWAIFGIPKGSYEMQGAPTAKTTLYIMQVETESPQKATMDACRALFRDVQFEPDIQTCTFANASFHWGCCGSPVVAVTPKDNLEQIAVLFKASTVEDDPFHMIVKTYIFNNWIRSVGKVPFDNP